MIKKLTLVLFIAFSLILKGQNKNSYSVGFNTYYYYPVLGGQAKNNINYGLSMFISETFDNYKINLGVSLSTKNYYYLTEPVTSMDFLKKRTYDIKYLDIPILINYFLNQKKSTSVLIGLIPNKMISYKITSYYIDKDSFIDKDLDKTSNFSLKVRLGASFFRKISNHFIINTSIYTDYKLILDSNKHQFDYKSIPNNRFSFGLKIGIEYII